MAHERINGPTSGIDDLTEISERALAIIMDAGRKSEAIAERMRLGSGPDTETAYVNLLDAALQSARSINERRGSRTASVHLRPRGKGMQIVVERRRI